MPAGTPPAEATALVAEGRALQRQQRNASALAAFDRALDLAPELESAWMSKALLLEDLERFDEALAAYAALLARQPAHAAAASNRAGLLLQLGRLEEARVAMEQALAADPGNHLLALNQGLLLLQGFHDPEAARPWLERAQAAGLPEAAEALAHADSLLEKGTA